MRTRQRCSKIVNMKTENQKRSSSWKLRKKASFNCYQRQRWSRENQYYHKSGHSIKQDGLKVALDVDFGLANIDVLFGIIPKYTMLDLIHEERIFLKYLLMGPIISSSFQRIRC